MTKKNLSTRFQEKKNHEEVFGLKITERDVEGEVMAAVCQFCRTYGRERKSDSRKKPRVDHHTFRFPFRTDNYRSHLKNEHPRKWEEYSKLTSRGKARFFEHAEPLALTLHPYLRNPEIDRVKFLLTKNIVDKAVRALLFEPHDDEDEEDRAEEDSFFKQLKESEDGYEVSIQNRQRFKLVLGFLIDGATFREVAKYCKTVRKIFKHRVQGVEHGTVAFYARLSCALSLDKLREILEDAWCFAIAFDCANKHGMNILSVRLRVYRGSSKHCDLFLLAIPLYQNKTALYLTKRLTTLLTSLSSDWKKKLLSITSDGEPTMRGPRGGVQKRLEDKATFPLIKIWCAIHQLDLKVQQVYKGLELDDNFIAVMNSIIKAMRISHPRHFNGLCPRFVSTRWLSMRRVSSWICEHYLEISEVIDQFDEDLNPGAQWWVAIHAINEISGVLSNCYTKLQTRGLTIEEQEERLAVLQEDLEELCIVYEGDPAPSPATVEKEDLFVNTKDVRTFFADLGRVVLELQQELTEAEENDLGQKFGNLFLDLKLAVEGVKTVRGDDEGRDTPAISAQSLAEQPPRPCSKKLNKITRS